MVLSISPGKIRQIRQAVKAGKSRYKVAEELRIGATSVYKYTNDLPKMDRRPIRDEIRKQIKNDMKTGMSGLAISRKYSVNPVTVYKITRDIPKTSGNSGIRGIALSAMKELMEKGYIITSKNITKSAYITLRKYFSDNIRRVFVKDQMVYFIKGKEKEAFKAFMEVGRYRIMSYGKMCNLMKPFGIKMSPKEKREMLSG